MITLQSRVFRNAWDLISLIFDKLGRANFWELLLIGLVLIVSFILFSVLVLWIIKLIIRLSKYEVIISQSPDFLKRRHANLIDYYVERHNNKDYTKMLYNVHKSLLNVLVGQQESTFEKYNDLTSKYSKSTSGTKSALLSISDQIQKSNTQNRELLMVIKTLQHQYDTLTKLVEDKNSEVEILKNGYNYTILKSFINKLILLIHDLQFSGDEDKVGKNLVIESIENVLTEAHVYRIEVQQGTLIDPKVAKVFDTEMTNDAAQNGLISKVVTHGYMIKQGEINSIIAPAAVYVYKYEEEVKSNEERSRD